MIDTQDLPYPIAKLYAEMELETDPGKRFRGLIKAFSGFLKYISLIALSDYLTSGCADERINKLLVGQSFARPSLGHWNHFLREILRHQNRSECPPAVTGLVEFYFRRLGGRKPKPSENVARIETLIQLRNEYVHPDIWPADEVSESLCEVHTSTLDTLIAQADFIVSHPLILTTEEESLYCRGSQVAEFRRGHRRDDLSPGHFYLETKGGALSFLTFLLYGRPHNLAPRAETTREQDLDILLYDSQTTKKVKFQRGNYLSYLDRSEFDEIDDILEDLKSRLGQNERIEHREFKKQNVTRPDWNRLFDFCKTSSERTVSFHVGEHKYHENFYLPRVRLEESYWNFVGDSKRIAFLVGDSGSGKTNLLCHLTEASLGRGHGVLHFSGRNCVVGKFFGQVADELVVEPTDLIDFLRGVQGSNEVGGGRRLLLFVDAINESSDPEALYDEIQGFISSLDEGGVTFCKLLVSMRTATWHRMESNFDFPKRVVYYSRSDDDVEQPYLAIERFTPEETRQAYELYRRGDDSETSATLVRREFRFRLETPFDELPISVRVLVSNPIFLRFLALSRSRVTEDVDASQVLLDYHENTATLPRKHRYLLHYLLRALWDKRDDFLDEDEIVAFGERDLPEEDYRRKIVEYYTEDPVNTTSPRYQCTTESCSFAKKLLRADETRDGRCALCKGPTKSVAVPTLSTFFFLKDEGIISVFESGSTDGTRVLIRFTYDRFFEAMMGRYLLSLLNRESGASARAELLERWVAETEASPIYDEVLVHLLILALDKTAVEDEEDPRGVLFRLAQSDLRFDDWYRLVAGILERPESRRIHIVVNVLCQLGVSEKKRRAARSFVMRLCEKCADMKTPARLRLSHAHVVLEVAQSLHIREPFVLLAGHEDANLRMLAACYVYFTWSQDHRVGLELVERVFQRMFYPLGIPKLRPTEFVLGTAAIILLGHPEESESVEHLLSLGRRLVRKSRLWSWAAISFLPGFVARILKDVPSDYNPINLTELRLAKKELLADEELRRTGLEYVQLLRQPVADWAKQKEIAFRIVRKWPRNEFLMLVHQLVMGKASHQDIDAAVAAELDIAEEARRLDEDFWVGIHVYNIYWFNIGGRKMSDESLERTVASWQRLCADRNFKCYCHSTQPYYSWGLVTVGQLISERTGSRRVPLLEHQIDRLLEEADDDGLYAFLRGLDIMGPELGAGAPRVVDLTLALIRHVINGFARLPERFHTMLARTMHRMEVLFPKPMELFMSSLESSPALSRLEELKREMVPDESIGVWASQRGQAFYLHAMRDRYWQELFADVFENALTSRSLSSSLRYLTRRIVRELSD